MHRRAMVGVCDTQLAADAVGTERNPPSPLLEQAQQLRKH